MTRINVKQKGAQGEREAALFLKSVLNLCEAPKRNLEQTRSGGWDLRVKNFVFEVKRCEKLLFEKWWAQAVKSAQDTAEILPTVPIVLYRQNRREWRILAPQDFSDFSKGFYNFDHGDSIDWLRKYILMMK